MSDEPILRIRSRSSSGSGRALRLPVLALSAGIWLLAISELGQTWETARIASSYEPPARIGDLVSATLVNGQVFFGTLDSASRTTIRLRDVFFARLPQPGAVQDQQGDDRSPTILRRRDNEWTQADTMAIPVERIGFMETVGVDSRMARFIADARSHPASLPSGKPSDKAPDALPSAQSPKG
jgi:hypothetical protein